MFSRSRAMKVCETRRPELQKKNSSCKLLLMSKWPNARQYTETDTKHTHIHVLNQSMHMEPLIGCLGERCPEPAILLPPLCRDKMV